MKKIAILIGFCLIATMLPTFIPQPVHAMTGSGTPGDPYVIYNVTDLQNMANNLTAYYVLNNNIDASATSGWNGGAGFLPVGNGAVAFTGNFDGNGFAITGLYISRSTTDYIGLFGKTSGATITNVSILSATIWGRQCTSVAVGYASSSSLQYIKTSGSVTSSSGYVGGLVGNIVSSTVYRCASEADVAGQNYRGGLIGYMNGGTTAQCFATGDVTGSTYEGGGLVGMLYPDGSISNCYARGDVIGGGQIGGLVGHTDRTPVITNSYATGVVAGTLYTGGLIGFVQTPTPDCSGVTGSFWDTQTSGQATSGCGIGKTTAEMKTESTFTSAGWDFATVWGIGGLINDGYPYLLWWYNPPAIISDVNQVVWFQPNTIIQGNTLPNRAQNGTLEDGNFFWGTNPAGVDIEMSEFYSDSQYPVYNYTLPSDAMAPSQDMLGPTGNPGWTPDFPSNAGNPFYPIVNLFAGFWNVAIGLLWPILAWLFIAIMMTLCYKYAPHQMITLFVGGGLAVFFYFWGVIPGWSVFVFVGMGLAVVIGERSPTVS